MNATRFKKYDKVKINYPRAPYRIGFVLQDDGGPKVQVRWRSQDGPKVARNVVAYHGRSHDQWIDRDRLERLGEIR